MNPRLKVMSQRPAAFINMLSRSLQSYSRLCPSCGGTPIPGTVDRRYLVMSLVRCSKCELLYRTPTDTTESSTEFYQEDYTEESVSEMPDSETLEKLMAEQFSSKGDLSPYISLIRRFHSAPNARLVDYGCSWGYNTWRFGRAGFIASGVEISRPRCDFGRDHLGVDAHYHADSLSTDYDVFFSSHVFEHVPSPEDAYRQARKLLGDKGGLFIVITPNGSDAFRKKRPDRWHELWGRKHPNFLDDRFWKHLLQDMPHTILSRSEDGSVLAPLDSITPGNLGKHPAFDLSGEELIVVAMLPQL